MPPLYARTFLRDSVEKIPEKDHYADRSAAYIVQEPEFGSRSLPLRAAVEKVPDM